MAIHTGPDLTPPSPITQPRYDAVFALPCHAASNRHGRFKPVVKYRLVETATHFNPLSEILDRYADGTPGSV